MTRREVLTWYATDALASWLTEDDRIREELLGWAQATLSWHWRDRRHISDGLLSSVSGELSSLYGCESAVAGLDVDADADGTVTVTATELGTWAQHAAATMCDWVDYDLVADRLLRRYVPEYLPSECSPPRVEAERPTRRRLTRVLHAYTADRLYEWLVERADLTPAYLDRVVGPVLRGSMRLQRVSLISLQGEEQSLHEQQLTLSDGLRTILAAGLQQNFGVEAPDEMYPSMKTLLSSSAAVFFFLCASIPSVWTTNAVAADQSSHLLGVRRGRLRRCNHPAFFRPAHRPHGRRGGVRGEKMRHPSL